ncbi:MAG: TIGR03936 family radical SAM-associated protein [candidate division Zixibacteria bacterium]|nr:TIGR03936 family radical SAM-associated protein [candidate division Zixibacteria bacterium]
MKELLARRFYPFVIKPGRYAGGEPGQCIKDPTGRLSYLHAYPDRYEVGQTALSVQTIYHLINRDDRFLCERVFAPDHDAQALLKTESIPLFAIESGRPAKDFDLLGFTLVDTTVYTNVLTMIELAGITLDAERRGEDEPLVLAGGPATSNPEPMARFIDLFFLGDAEEGLLEILTVVHENKGQKRKNVLEQICRNVPSVYVPAFYDSDRKPLFSFAPAVIRSRVVEKLRSEFYPKSPLLPLVETLTNNLPVEISRGSGSGCERCQTNPVSAPVRVRPSREVAEQVQSQLGSTGYSEVCLLSPPEPDRPEFDSLINSLAKQLESRRVSVILPALRPGTVSAATLEALTRVKRPGLTIAPEAGTERLRLLIHRDFPDAAIYDTARLAFSKGWNSIKLVFMLGLPTETHDDLKGISDICKEIVRIGEDYRGKKNLTVLFAPFLPKPHTPFQWDGSLSEAELMERVGYVKRLTRINSIQFKLFGVNQGLIAVALGRGGREMASVIETAYRSGCRFDGWQSDFSYERWIAALAAHGFELPSLLSPLQLSTSLPWSHIHSGADCEQLKQERQTTPFTIRAFTPLFHDKQDIFGAVQPEESVSEFGRSKKKVASKNAAAPTKNRVRVKWSKSARYKYMSHLDNMRLLERVIRRAELPVAYSQGMTPTMKLSFGPPLPLGFTSEAEYVDITLETNCMPYMIDDLKKALPDGIEIVQASIAWEKNSSLSAALNRVEYVVPIDEWNGLDTLDSAIEAVMSASTLPYIRKDKDKEVSVDLKPGIFAISRDQKMLSMSLGIGDGGYVRPAEVLSFLSQGLIHLSRSIPFHRKRIYRMEPDGRITDPMDI